MGGDPATERRDEATPAISGSGRPDEDGLLDFLCLILWVQSAHYTVLRTLTDGIIGYARIDGHFVVLKAFFDDSGTHLESDVAVMAGLIAPEDEWATLETEWRIALDDLGIRKMHMASCENARRDFAGWDRDRRDRAIARFCGIILKRNACMLISAVSRSTWNAVAPYTLLGKRFAQPIDYCFNACMRYAMQTIRGSVGREPVAITFDGREESLGYWQRLASAYEEVWPERVAGFAFGNMEKVLPLQAADMIAYEAFVFECARGRQEKEPTPRPNFSKLVSALQFKGGFATEEILHEYAEHLASLAARRASSAT
jgi:hypothetical protein